MKTTRRIFSVLLALLLLTQCAWLALAQSPTIPYCRLVYNDRTEDGDLLPTYYVDEDGRRIEMPQTQTVTAAAESYPEKYDLRDQGVVTSVKNQAGAWNCWAFAATSCMEISYIRQGLGTASNTDFAEAHLIWFGHRSRTTDQSDPTYGDGIFYSNPFMKGGSWEEAAATIMRGSGMQLEKNAKWIDSYQPDVLMGMAQKDSDRYVSYARLWQATQIPDDQLSVSAIKSRIMEYGGLEIYYYDDFNYGNTAFSNTYHSYYQTAKVGASNHAVTLIGWDDTFPRTHFNKTAPSNGAWLVKGSWSEGYGNSGYCWLSYCDPSIMKCASFAAAPADIFDNIYQYDGVFPNGGFPLEGSAAEANLFTAKKAETLTHVGVFSPNPQTMYVTVRVWVDEGRFELKDNDPTNGMVRKSTTTIRNMEYGYRTIPIDRLVTLKAGQKFAIEVIYTEPDGGTFVLPVEGVSPKNPSEGVPTYGGNTGESFIHVVGRWEDTNRTKITGSADYTDFNNVPIKAMTCDLGEYEPTLRVSTQPTKTQYYQGDTLDTAGLTLIYSDDKGKETTVRSGFSCSPTRLTQTGEQEITVSYQGLQTTFTVQVQPVSLKLSNDSVTMRYGHKKQLSVTAKPDTLQVHWSSDDTSVATVSDTGLVRATGEGRTAIHAVATYAGEQYDVSCAVRVDDPPVRSIRTNIAQTLYEGDSLGIPTIDVIYTDGSMSVFTDGFDYSPKTFDTAGGQTVTLTFGQWSDSFTVEVEPLEIFLNHQQRKMYIGNTYQLQADTSPTGMKVLWSTSDASVVTVSQTGLLTAKAPGDAQIEATIVNGTKQCKDVCAVHVEDQAVRAIRTNIAQTLYEGDTLRIPTVDVIYNDGSTVTLETGFDYSPKTMETAGEQTITLTYGQWSDTMTVVVKALTVTLDPQKLDLRVGQTAQLSASTQPTGLKVTWSSSNAAVASVSASGFVNAKSAGSAIIRATVTNGTKQYTATCVTRITKVPTLTIKAPSRTTLKYGQSLTLHAEAANLPAGARILWTEGTDLTDHPGENSDTYTVKAEKSGNVTATAYLVDSGGNVIRDASGDPVKAQQTITMKCGILQIIGSFFRKLFGIRTHYPDVVE